jgi:hypothetical protein
MARRDMASVARLGGLALKDKEAPLSCPRCGKQFRFCESWFVYLGHLGLHGLADKHFGGDIQAAQKRLRENGLARQEAGASWQNGAFKPYRKIGD